jgi:hypothetical protein
MVAVTSSTSCKQRNLKYSKFLPAGSTSMVVNVSSPQSYVHAGVGQVSTGRTTVAPGNT